MHRDSLNRYFGRPLIYPLWPLSGLQALLGYDAEGFMAVSDASPYEISV